MNLPCDKCNGTGNMELTPKLALTFKILQTIGPTYFKHILDMSDPTLKASTLANRLRRLINIGLVFKSEDLRYTTKPKRTGGSASCAASG